MPNCSAPPIGVDTIGDQVGLYQGSGHDSGYYGGGRNVHTPEHHKAIAEAADAVMRLDAQGQPDPCGEIGLVGLGFSYSVAVFDAIKLGLGFLSPAPRDGLVPVNCAYPGKDASNWADPNDWVWTTHVPAMLTVAGVSPAQVQVAYLLTGLRDSGGVGYPQHVVNLTALLKAIAANARAVFPNLKLLYLDSVHAHHYTNAGITPDVEPTFLEQGFAVRQVILDQLAGDQQLAPSVAPVLDWGGRLWCDGARADSRGHDWLCPTDVRPDGHHTSVIGSDKLADLVLDVWREAVHARWLYGAPGSETPGGGVPPTQEAG